MQNGQHNGERPVTVGVDDAGELRVVTVTGDVDFLGAETLRTSLEALVSHGAKGLLVDLSEVRTLGALAVAALFEVHLRTVAAGVRFAVVAGQSPTFAALYHANADCRIELHPSLDQAHASIRNQVTDRGTG